MMAAHAASSRRLSRMPLLVVTGKLFDHRFLRQSGYQEKMRTARVCAHHFKTQAVELDHIPALGHMAQPLGRQPAYRV